jgi:ubiquinone/menaquinone biosynthesis C-methylase UbiE
MKQAIISQFGHPTGFLGSVVGRLMASSNRERVVWAVDLLNVRPTDTVLEVGFGPGVASELVAQTADTIHIHGIVASAVMLWQASQRNKEGSVNGRIHLQQGTATHLPYEANTFNKAFAINSLHHWPDAAAGLRELWRVLQPGGTVAIIEQPRWAKTEAEVQQSAQRLEAQLQQAGLQQIKCYFKPMQPVTSIAVFGVK